MHMKAKTVLHKSTTKGYRLTHVHPTYVASSSDTVIWYKVVWCAQNMRRDGSSFTWHQLISPTIKSTWHAWHTEYPTGMTSLLLINERIDNCDKVHVLGQSDNF